MTIVLHRFPLSHFSEKVRVMLDFKGLDYRVVDHSPGPDQLAIMKLSGQRKVPVIEHLVAHLEAAGERIDKVVDLQPTSPLRAPGDVERCLDAMDGADLALSVYPSDIHPAFNLVELGPDGAAHLWSRAGAVRRQDLRPVYALNGSIYCWQRPALPRAVLDGVWSLNVRGVPMPRERSADIDDMLDFEWAAWLYRRQLAASGAP